MTIELSLEILPDPQPRRAAGALQAQGPYRLVVILAPHLGSTGRDNSAWVEEGCRLCAARGNVALCLAAESAARASELRLCRCTPTAGRT